MTTEEREIRVMRRMDAQAERAADRRRQDTERCRCCTDVVEAGTLDPNGLCIDCHSFFRVCENCGELYERGAMCVKCIMPEIPKGQK